MSQRFGRHCCTSRSTFCSSPACNVTCMWCARCYLGMPNYPLWSEVAQNSDSEAATERMGDSASYDSHESWMYSPSDE
eukprot:3730753-Rhodomonas_salina.1